MEPHIIYLTDDQGEMLKEFLSLPEDDQRFIRMIIEIGPRNFFERRLLLFCPTMYATITLSPS